MISWQDVVALKRALVCVTLDVTLGRSSNHRIHTGCVPGTSGRRQHPWLWRSSSWRAQCSNSIPDDVLKELLHDTTGFLVVEATVSQTADGQLVDTLDFVSQYLPVPLCIPFLSPFPPLPRPDMIANWYVWTQVKNACLCCRQPFIYPQKHGPLESPSQKRGPCESPTSETCCALIGWLILQRSCDLYTALFAQNLP